MRIAIHSTKGTFSDRWIEYCEAKQISWKKVDCYRNDIIDQLSNCDALMWHYHQSNPKDILFAKQFLFAIQGTGIKVFPDFNTAWHFDDKIGQKYLLDAIGAPVPHTWVFYDKHEALEWAKKTDFPKVFKLRGGAGSQNVRLVKTVNECKRLIHKAFGRGFLTYDASGNLKERIRRYKLGKTNFRDIVKGLVRFVFPPPYARLKAREKKYIYLQEYISGNDHDIRVIVVNDKAFAIKRMVRSNDFRASGSGMILYERNLFDENIIKLSFELSLKIKSQCIAFDFVQDKGKPLVVEISYGFSPQGYDPCTGYWDKYLRWHEGKFNPYGWMVEDLIRELKTEKIKEGV